MAWMQPHERLWDRCPQLNYSWNLNSKGFCCCGCYFKLLNFGVSFYITIDKNTDYQKHKSFLHIMRWRKVYAKWSSVSKTSGALLFDDNSPNREVIHLVNVTVTSHFSTAIMITKLTASWSSDQSKEYLTDTTLSVIQDQGPSRQTRDCNSLSSLEMVAPYEGCSIY